MAYRRWALDERPQAQSDYGGCGLLPRNFARWLFHRRADGTGACRRACGTARKRRARTVPRKRGQVDGIRATHWAGSTFQWSGLRGSSASVRRSTGARSTSRESGLILLLQSDQRLSMWRAPVPSKLRRVINERGRRCHGGIYTDRAAGSVLRRFEHAGAGSHHNGFPRRVPGVVTSLG